MSQNKEAFEATGLIPRSIIRTVDRFVQQLLPGKENIAIQEYRVSRYQILVSIKSLLQLFLIPLLVNSILKALLFTPLIEHFWNLHQTEIFLNQYQEKRAFAEMQDFSEKMFFEDLLSPELLPEREKTDTDFINNSFSSQDDGHYNLFKNLQYLPDISNRKTSSSGTNPVNLFISGTDVNRGNRFSADGERYDFLLEENKLQNFTNVLTPSQPFNLFCELHDSHRAFWLGNGADLVWSRDGAPVRLLWGSAPFPIPHSPFPNQLKPNQTKPKHCKETPNQKVQCKTSCKAKHQAQFVTLPLAASTEDAGVTFSQPKIMIHTDESALQNQMLQKNKTSFQTKSLQLAGEYNQQSILAITNLLGDFVTFLTVYGLFKVMRPEIIILKSFLTESVYSLSDTTKSFLLILVMDLLVGFHSPRAWEIVLETFLRHIGLPESENFILLFVALFPVFLDTVFKYWIFRYLNKISPSTVVTYHSMIE